MTEEIILDTKSNKFYEKIKRANDLGSFLGLYSELIDKKVVGWFYPVDIVAFYYLIMIAQKEIDGDMCELGVAFGKSAIGLSLLRDNNEILYLYDFFVSPDISKESASEVIERYGNNTNIEWRIQDLYKLKTEDIQFNKKIKFLHIDSCHQHTTVLKDLNNFSVHMLDNGIISLDDFNDPNYPGVNTAVSEFILSDTGKDWRIFAIGNNKAYLCKKDYFDFYRNGLVKWIMQTIEKININFSEIFDKECALLVPQQSLSHQEIEEYLENKKERFYG